MAPALGAESRGSLAAACRLDDESLSRRTSFGVVLPTRFQAGVGEYDVSERSSTAGPKRNEGTGEHLVAEVNEKKIDGFVDRIFGWTTGEVYEAVPHTMSPKARREPQWRYIAPEVRPRRFETVNRQEPTATVQRGSIDMTIDFPSTHCHAVSWQRATPDPIHIVDRDAGRLFIYSHANHSAAVGQRTGLALYSCTKSSRIVPFHRRVVPVVELLFEICAGSAQPIAPSNSL